MLWWHLYVTALSFLPLLSPTADRVKRHEEGNPFFVELVSSMCHHVFMTSKFITEVNPYLTNHLVSQSQRYLISWLGKAWAVIFFGSNGYSLVPSSQVKPQHYCHIICFNRGEINGVFHYIPPLLTELCWDCWLMSETKNHFIMPLCEGQTYRNCNKTASNGREGDTRIQLNSSK